MMTRAEQFDLARRIAYDAFRDAIDIVAIVETLLVLDLRHEARRRKLDEAGASRTADLVWRALVSRLLFVVTRHYAAVKPGADDLHAEAAFELLKNDPTLASDMPDPNAIAEAQRLWAKCRGDHRRHGVHTLRDKELAHLGEWPPAMPRPNLNDALAFARATASALEKLAHGAGMGLSVDNQVPAYKQSAERFFAPWDAK